MSAEQAAVAPAQPQMGRYHPSPYEIHPEDLQDWTFQEKDAEELKNLGRTAAERAKVLVQAQETVLRNIQAKLLVDPDAALAEANYHAQVKAQQQQQQLLEKSASAPVLGHHAGASAVARKAAAREEKAAQFQMRRQALISEEQQSRHRLVEQQDFASARFAERQKVAQLERHRKLRNLYSSRQEVQKINREMEREQERARDAYYLREEMRAAEKERSMHPTRSLAWSLGLVGTGSTSITGAASPTGSSPTGSSSPALLALGGQAVGRSRGTMPMGWSVEGQGAEEEGDDIYSSTLKSHAVYDGTMHTWQQYVWENDVRAEHYWRKMIVNEGDRAALRGGAGGTPGGRETIKRHPRDFRLPEFLLEERKDRNSRKAQQRRSSIRQVGRRRSSGVAFDTMLSREPGNAGADGLSPRASPGFRSPGAYTGRASALRKSPTAIGPTTIKHTEEMPPPEAWALPKLPDKTTPAVSSSVDQVEFSTRPFSGGATELPEVRSAQGPRLDRSVTIQQPSSAAGSTTSETLPEVQPTLGRSSTEGRSRSKPSPNEGYRDGPRGSKSRTSGGAGGSFNPRMSKARFAEADLISIRTAIFKNEHRTSLRASDLRKMREYAAASSPDNMVTFTRTT